KVVMNNTDKPRRASRGRDTREERDPRRESSTARRAGRPARHEGGASRPEGAAPRRETGAPRREGAAPAGRPYVMAAVRIEQVRSVLGEILQWEYPADAALSHWLRAHPKLGMRDRGEVAEAVFDVLRHLRRYRQYAEGGSAP